MEGGAVDFNGAGTVMTTTSCLLNKNRNPTLSKGDIERFLKAYYGQRHVVWLGKGIEGDDTDGHIDDLARFVDARTIVIGSEDDPRDANYQALRDNRRRLDRLRDQDGRPFNVVEVPMPRPVTHCGQRLPATYMNFYFVNGALLVPTFGQARRDAKALAILQGLLPRRAVVGVNCRDLATFGEDLGVAERLARRLPTDVIAVAESAIREPADARRMAEAGFDAVLVGEALVRAPDPTALVAELAAIPVAPREQRERDAGDG